MSFFRKKKNKVTHVPTVSPASQIRKIIYDSGCKYPEVVANMLGLTGVSEEVAEMEEEASDFRLSKIGPILPIIEMHSLISAQVSAMTYFASAAFDGEEEPAKEILEAMVNLFKFVSFSAAVSCISALVELDLVSERYKNE